MVRVGVWSRVSVRDRAIFTKRQGQWKTRQGKNFFQSP